MFSVCRVPATQIVGNVIVWIEIEMRIDAAVHQLGHMFIELTRWAVVQGVQVVLADHGADMEMHMAFRLHDARQDAVEIFALLFFIMPVLARQIQLHCL